jgi:hypothetical protein
MTKAKSGSENESAGNSPAQLIDARIKELGDWRGETLAHIRKLIKEATRTWSRSGSGEASRCGITTE